LCKCMMLWNKRSLFIVSDAHVGKVSEIITSHTAELARLTVKKLHVKASGSAASCAAHVQIVRSLGSAKRIAVSRQQSVFPVAAPWLRVAAVSTTTAAGRVLRMNSPMPGCAAQRHRIKYHQGVSSKL